MRASNRFVLSAVAAMTAACGFDRPERIRPVDAAVPSDVGDDGQAIVHTPCNVLTQDGCSDTEKCTWVFDYASATSSIGHVDCVPNGNVAVDGACTRPPPGIYAYDDCAKGSYCDANALGGDGTCRAICDFAGGTPSCPSTGGPVNLGYACSTTSAFRTGTSTLAGICYRRCDPLADNDFKGSGVKSGVGYTSSTGNACAADEGCFGLPNDDGVDKYLCGKPCSGASPDCPNLTHRRRAGSDFPFINSCAQGYVPMLYESRLVTQIICTAFCDPVDCYAGNCGSGTYGNLIGAAPHQCHPNDIRGNVTPATLAGNNTEHCVYSWIYQHDGNQLNKTPSSDQVGICLDHSQYWYDAIQDGVPDSPYPRCNTFTQITGTGVAVSGVCNGSNGCLGASDMGCVSSATAGLFTGKAPTRPPLIDLPRPLYNLPITNRPRRRLIP